MAEIFQIFANTTKKDLIRFVGCLAIDCRTKQHRLRCKMIGIEVQKCRFCNFWLQAKDLSLISKRPCACKQNGLRLQANSVGHPMTNSWSSADQVLVVVLVITNTESCRTEKKELFLHSKCMSTGYAPQQEGTTRGSIHLTIVL